MRDYKELVESFKRPNRRIILCIPPPIFGLFPPTRINITVVHSLMPGNDGLIAKIANETHSEYIDFFTPIAEGTTDFRGRTRFSRDGVHPNQEGFMVLGEVVAKYLNNSLDKS